MYMEEIEKTTVNTTKKGNPISFRLPPSYEQKRENVREQLAKLLFTSPSEIENKQIEIFLLDNQIKSRCNSCGSSNTVNTKNCIK